MFTETINLCLRHDNMLYYEHSLEMTDNTNYNDFFISLDRVNNIY